MLLQISQVAEAVAQWDSKSAVRAVSTDPNPLQPHNTKLRAAILNPSAAAYSPDNAFLGGLRLLTAAFVLDQVLYVLPKPARGQGDGVKLRRRRATCCGQFNREATVRAWLLGLGFVLPGDLLARRADAGGGGAAVVGAEVLLVGDASVSQRPDVRWAPGGGGSSGALGSPLVPKSTEINMLGDWGLFKTPLGTFTSVPPGDWFSLECT